MFILLDANGDLFAGVFHNKNIAMPLYILRHIAEMWVVELGSRRQVDDTIRMFESHGFK
jgi:hypothetical protein